MASFSTRFYFTTSEITKLVVRNLSGVDYTFTQSGVAQQIEGTVGDILTVTATVIDGYKIKSVINGTVVDKTHFTIPLGTEVFSVNSAEDLPILATPSNLAINNNILTFDEVANATSYEVFVDNVSIGTVEGAVTDELAGTWVFNERLNTTTLETTSVNFTSNGKTCSSITRVYSAGPFTSDAMLYNFDGLDRQVYDSNYWANAGYKTITITSKLSEVTNGDTLLAWLQANAVKQ